MTDLDDMRAAIARALSVPDDAVDAFVLRRVDAGRLVHLGGAGRAAGWAGVIDLTVDDEPLLRTAWEGSRPVCHEGAEASRIFGPYWARSAIVVPLPPDHIVVIGSSTPLDGAGDPLPLATALVEHIGEVSPAKRLADELEVLHAVRDIALATAPTVQATADRIVRIATDALSCELGVLWVADAGVLAVADDLPGGLDAPPERLLAVATQLLDRREALPHCEQENAARPLPDPLGAASPVLAWFAVPIAGPPDGLLLLCHTTAGPRGFTVLCQQVGRSIADAAAAPLATALAQERLAEELARASVEARRDPLTGLANRRVWLESVAELSDDRRRHDAVVVMLDVDGLKQVNDRFGHRIGDDVLRGVAGVVEASARDGDVTARLGGDEFAILLRDGDDAAARAVAQRIDTAIDRLPPFDGHHASASVGWAHAAPGTSLDEAMRTADRRMYAAKRARRTTPHRVPVTDLTSS